MKVLVTGATGQVGRELVSCGAQSVTRADLDLTAAGTSDFAAAARDLLAGVDVLVNCGAWTDVDGAEDDTNAAVSGLSSNNDYVITTSSKPLEAGELVRMVDGT